MANIRTIRDENDGYICRRCINWEYGVKLRPDDCEYGYPYKMQCPVCSRMMNIVTGLKASGRIKLLFK